jgi:short-subunit dehydrogenase
MRNAARRAPGVSFARDPRSLEISKGATNMGTAGIPRGLGVVTGASTGIGLELAREMGKNGFDLVICAEESRIETAARDLAATGANVTPVQVDLTTYEGVEELYARIQAMGRPIDAIAINAGIGVEGDFARETSLRDELKLLQLNVISTVHIAKRVLPDMVARGKGRVLFTASIAGIMPTPMMAVYGASKAFVLELSASLHSELKDSGVTVTALMPGPTRSSSAAPVWKTRRSAPRRRRRTARPTSRAWASKR